MSGSQQSVDHDFGWPVNLIENRVYKLTSVDTNIQYIYFKIVVTLEHLCDCSPSIFILVIILSFNALLLLKRTTDYRYTVHVGLGPIVVILVFVKQ